MKLPDKKYLYNVWVILWFNILIYALPKVYSEIVLYYLIFNTVIAFIYLVFFLGFLIDKYYEKDDVYGEGNYDQLTSSYNWYSIPFSIMYLIKLFKAEKKRRMHEYISELTT